MRHKASAANFPKATRSAPRSDPCDCETVDCPLAWPGRAGPAGCPGLPQRLGGTLASNTAVSGEVAYPSSSARGRGGVRATPLSAPTASTASHFCFPAPVMVCQSAPPAITRLALTDQPAFEMKASTTQQVAAARLLGEISVQVTSPPGRARWAGQGRAGAFCANQPLSVAQPQHTCNIKRRRNYLLAADNKV